MQPGTKAQLKPTFPKDATAKKAKKEDKDDHDDDGSTTETDERIRKWIATGDMRAQEVGLHGHGANLMADIEEADDEISTPTQTPGVLPMPIPGANPSANAIDGGRGRDASVSSTRTSSLSVPPGSRRVNPSFAAPEGLEKVQLVVKWGGEVRPSLIARCPSVNHPVL